MKKTENSALGRLNIEEFQQSEKLPIAVVLDNIRSQHNIGSVFRTADAFRVSQIALCGITATPPQAEIHKAALGATETVDWKYFASTKEAIIHLKACGYKIIAIEQTDKSIPLNEFAFSHKPDKIALVFGHEVFGVDDDVLNFCDFAIEVPMFGTKHSLNISVCVGVVLWELSKTLVINGFKY